MECHDVEAAIEGILFASGEPVPAARLAQVLGIDEETVYETARKLGDAYRFDRRGIRLLRIEESLQLCSAPELGDLIRRTLERRKPPQLTQTALEVLAIAAYYQPVTRAYIESVRGVDSAYTVGVLQDRGLIEQCGNLQVPGRPALFRTTGHFLRAFGLVSLDELPPLPDIEEGSEAREAVQRAIDALSDRGEKQMELSLSLPEGEKAMEEESR